MTIGEGIFFSSVLLSIVVVFAVTRDRWNWRRIVKWGVLLPVGSCLALGLGFFIYGKWQDRVSPQTSFQELSLTSSQSDVKFIKGAPSSIDGPDRWVYNVGSYYQEKSAAQVLVQFKDGVVRFVLYTADRSEVFNPNLLGFAIGSPYGAIQEKLGEPSHIAISDDQLDRMYSYDRLNVFFSFRQGQLVAYGIYQPSGGPMKFQRYVLLPPEK